MSRDHWLEILVTVEAAAVARAETALAACGALAVTCRASGGHVVCEDGAGAPPALWPTCVVTGLFPGDANIEHIRRVVMAGVAQPCGVVVAALEDRAWDRAWMEHFEPMHFGNGLWVCPSWADVPDAQATVVRIDPGMAFGTGTHESTALCLEWIAASTRIAGATVLDFGCGSGVLAIAAAKRGASRVIAVDDDPAACAVARANTAANGCDGIEVKDPAALADERADVLIANILAKPLIALAPVFARHLRPRGSLVLAGILREQVAVVLAAYATGFKMKAPVYRGEWGRLSGQRSAGEATRHRGRYCC